MPTKRTRKSRTGRLSEAAAAWTRSEDAERFFTDPAGYVGTAVERLPGVRPWWNPLAEYWQAHRDGTPLPFAVPESAAIDAVAFRFVLDLYAEYRAARGDA